ncbi:MAG: hypothetical protein FWG90_06685 [Oscillospiraceae bacterium]|nr:hypothetical protein [Oscillospiraceae bacterium]
MQNLNYNNTVRIKNIDTDSPIALTLSEQSRRKQAEREEAIKWFLEDIAEARRIADEQGWLTQEDVERKLGYGVED